MKKILIITTIGGFLPQFEMNDVRILLEKGYEIHYASNMENPVYDLDRDALTRRGIRLHQIDIQKSPACLLRNLRAFLQLRKLMSSENFCAIHCHNPMGGVLGRLAALCVPEEERPYVIYTAHGFHFYDGAPFKNWVLYYPVEWLLAKCTDCLITINGEDARRAERFRGRRLKEIYRIPGVGVDTDRFAGNRAERIKVRNELGIGDGIFHILSVGELNSNKNHEVILRALALLNDPDIRYGICGKGCREERLRRLADELGIGEQVTFFGFRRDIPRMLMSADAFCFPSIREGLGIAALEAMASGTPLITSDCRGTREYMEEGITGYVCAGGTPEEYAALIAKMKRETEVRKSMAAACRKCSERFDVSRTELIMRKIYQGIGTETDAAESA